MDPFTALITGFFNTFINGIFLQIIAAILKLFGIAQ